MNILQYFYDNYSQYFPFFLACGKVIHKKYADYKLKSFREILRLSTGKRLFLQAKTRKAVDLKKIVLAV